MVPPPWRGARSLLPLNVSSNSKSKAWVFPLVSSFGHCPVYVSGFVHNHWAFNIILQSSTNWPTISIIWLMSPVDWVDVGMYGPISPTLFVVRTLEYVFHNSWLLWILITVIASLPEVKVTGRSTEGQLSFHIVSEPQEWLPWLMAHGSWLISIIITITTTTTTSEMTVICLEFGDVILICCCWAQATECCGAATLCTMFG